MTLEPGFLLSGAAALVGAVVWAVRIEGRVNGHQTLFSEREKDTDRRYTEIERRLVRIEEKLDKAKIALDSSNEK